MEKVILEKKVRTEELEKFLEKIENRTIVLEPTTTAIKPRKSERKTKSCYLIDSRIKEETDKVRCKGFG